MVKYKLGRIYTFSDREEAKEFIGMKGLFSDVYVHLMGDEDHMDDKGKRTIRDTLVHIDDEAYPFITEISYFQFFRPIIEELRMTYSELQEWITKGNGLITTDYKEGENDDELWWTVNMGSIREKNFDEKVPEGYRIRHFGTDEILVPTRDIFLKDCRGIHSEGV